MALISTRHELSIPVIFGNDSSSDNLTPDMQTHQSAVKTIFAVTNPAISQMVY